MIKFVIPDQLSDTIFLIRSGGEEIEVKGILSFRSGDYGLHHGHRYTFTSSKDSLLGATNGDEFRIKGDVYTVQHVIEDMHGFCTLTFEREPD